MTSPLGGVNKANHSFSPSHLRWCAAERPQVRIVPVLLWPPQNPTSLACRWDIFLIRDAIIVGMIRGIRIFEGRESIEVNLWSFEVTVNILRVLSLAPHIECWRETGGSSSCERLPKINETPSAMQICFQPNQTCCVVSGFGLERSQIFHDVSPNEPISDVVQW